MLLLEQFVKILIQSFGIIVNMEKKIAISFLGWVCENCSRIQDNIVEYKGKMYVTYGKPFDNLKSTSDLFELYLKAD